MIITRNPDALDLPLPLDLSQGTSVTVGNFDGVHLGHQALLAMTCERAAATGTLPVAMTFNPHPLEVLTPYAPPRLTTPQARLALLEASGMALVMLVVFTSEFAAMSPETFVRRILLGTLNMRELLLGYDFTLGKGRAGQEQRERKQCSQDLFHENFLLFYISGHRPVGCEVRDQPFTEPTITPFSKKRCKKGYSTIMGRVETMISAYLMVSASITRLPRVSTSPSMSCEAVF